MTVTSRLHRQKDKERQRKTEENVERRAWKPHFSKPYFFDKGRGVLGSVCITKTEKAESEAQRGKPKGTLESESRNAIV